MSAPILCPDCGHDAFGHDAVIEKSNDEWILVCQEPGRHCFSVPRQCVEKWLPQHDKEIRSAALLEAAKAVSVSCKSGVELMENNRYPLYHIANFVTWICNASAIHALLAQEQAQGEGGGDA